MFVCCTCQFLWPVKFGISHLCLPFWCNSSCVDIDCMLSAVQSVGVSFPWNKGSCKNCTHQASHHEVTSEPLKEEIKCRPKIEHLQTPVGFLEQNPSCEKKGSHHFFPCKVGKFGNQQAPSWEKCCQSSCQWKTQRQSADVWWCHALSCEDIDEQKRIAKHKRWSAKQHSADSDQTNSRWADWHQTFLVKKIVAFHHWTSVAKCNNWQSRQLWWKILVSGCESSFELILNFFLAPQFFVMLLCNQCAFWWHP